jgi:hypothetical protein
MGTSDIETATLPDGVVVQGHRTEQDWWFGHDKSGYVDPALIARDLDQPRKHMNPDDLLALQLSIRTVGVRESLTVTPRHLAPWANVAPEEAHLPFVAVSGHRRRSTSLEESIPAVPIRVKVYANQADHEMDRSLLNGNRAPLTEIEEGWELVQLRKDGVTLEKLAASRGMSVITVYARINLTQLAPDIQAMLNPEMTRKRRLQSSVASALGGVKAPTTDELADVMRRLALPSGEEEVEDEEDDEVDVSDVAEDTRTDDERRFELQHFLLKVIELRNLNAARAVALIKEQSLRFQSSTGGAGRPVTRYEPARRREVFNTLLKVVVGSVVMTWTPAEIRRVFELSAREEIEGIIKKIAEIVSVLTGLQRILERIRDEKRSVRPETLDIMAGRGIRPLPTIEEMAAAAEAK